MAGLRVVIITAVFIALIYNTVGDQHNHRHARHQQRRPPPSVPCTNDPDMDGSNPLCPSTSTKSSTTQVTEDDQEEIISTTSESTTTTESTSDPTALQRAHWCRFNNGTYLPLGQTFMNTICTSCQCTTSRAIRCHTLQCLPTYCIDNTMPYRKDGQCCAQCGYEVARNSCEYNGATYPHGVVIKSVENKMQCWCQLGNIECRNYIGSLFDSLDMLSDERAIYIIVIILAVVLIFGAFICCTCTAAFYYYYQRHQHTFEQAYNQYINSAGWQPMNEEEQTEVDATANEKQFEAEQEQTAEFTNSMVPPPYAVHNESYVHEEPHKRM